MDTTNWTLEDHLEWMRYWGKQAQILDRAWLNRRVVTMMYYDLSWLKGYELSPHLDLLAVQEALLEHGPNPVLKKHRKD